MRKWAIRIGLVLLVLVLLSSIIYTPLSTCQTDNKRNRNIAYPVLNSYSPDNALIPTAKAGKNPVRGVTLVIIAVVLMGVTIHLVIRSVKKDAAKNPRSYPKKKSK